jgi:hypothetical protein
MGSFRILVLAGMASVLAGCAGGEKITASPTFVCTELKQYSPAEQNKAADEMEKHADEIPMVAAMIDDYGSLRAANKAVCGRKAKKSG